MTPQNTLQGLQDGVELLPLPSQPYEFTDRLVSRQDAAHFTIPTEALQAWPGSATIARRKSMGKPVGPVGLGSF